ncbi:chorismate mutase [Phyllobacterium leguminum]|uniref:chorismate mutase n=1 Tax=Phyllobacterium leguminum TaxID=314237 RepID=A0A318T7F9_9HYPH|nr:chorismate mutase [Phyllobacterium leguminum]PYE86444.1 chorismate mutase [Phyllobacterium leguminum]
MLKILCVIAFAMLPLSASAAENQQLFNLINQRLSYMKAVAAYKATAHSPVEDIAQEKKVVEKSTEQARKIGLDPKSVGPFLKAQIDAAKAIQYRYRADWLSVPEKKQQTVPLDILRSRIAKTGDAILTELHTVLSQGGMKPGDLALFDNAVTEPNLSATDKQKLFDALLEVKLKP